MSAMDEYLEFKSGLAYAPTPDGFRAAWKQMTGGIAAPESAVIEFGSQVVRLFMNAVRDSHQSDDAEAALGAGLTELQEKGTVHGWDPASYGYRIDVTKDDAAKEAVH
jgi:hypothetical protein